MPEKDTIASSLILPLCELVAEEPGVSGPLSKCSMESTNSHTLGVAVPEPCLNHDRSDYEKMAMHCLWVHI